jgi:hypothetical protein
VSAGLSYLPKDVSNLGGKAITATAGAGEYSGTVSVNVVKDAKGNDKLGPISASGLSHSKFLKLGAGMTAGAAIAETNTKTSVLTVDVGGAVDALKSAASQGMQLLNAASQVAGKVNDAVQKIPTCVRQADKPCM